MSRPSPLRVARRRWRVIVLALVIALAVILVGLNYLPRQYRATATLRLALAPTAAEPYNLNLADRLMNTYANLIDSRPVQQDLENLLGTTTLPRLSVKMPANTQLMLVSARHADPELAARAANALGAILVERSQQWGATTDASQYRFTIVAAAVPPTTASWPDTQALLLAGVAASLICAVGLGFFVDHMDATIATEPQLAALANGQALLEVPRAHLGSHPRPGEGTPPFLEAIRYLALAVGAREPDVAEGVVVLVAGCKPGDGSSTVAANLAAVASGKGITSLVIDCNLRRPTLHSRFDVANTVGLAGVLTGQAKATDAILTSKVCGVSVLPAGPSSNGSWQLIDSAPMGQLLRGIAERFDLTVIDAPPIAASADAPSLAPYADSTVLVVRRGKARANVVRSCLTSLEETGGGTVSLVLNG